ncbi:3'(2'),5'-bisphosphate nucleotidase CysQ [Gammaproteobacteria bacterium]|nr:3'(2'),5'-bisphosphate nucleotidase CysQ [Gammaproteobacteria bacterium]MDA7702938.1 3'(2'),5'-bisphosphate nucleotidase CysQ [Gammaproteobacteria bacterium]MDA7734666.1 3'(2'),5'-bisphosphate nucleotidase CysQ [Gammaproteobacteria bacterium]MDA8683116.1 3'(2'),5'-bisphosphate nucleotidase CysQ [Gammaproteobacteria bacterium]MDA8808545.1 3'(2'),5'-bisphosphate nucleotidase CysQ [Gammaproteobacteria bacterium]|tara:strand:+ start:1578 stop:2402 length:825 start_codon:yes stop_codon:yes gene_type:complete
MEITHKLLQDILNPIEETVRKASDAIMEVYKKDTFEKETKSDGSPVTEADNAANRIILDSLDLITPNIPVISEETFNKHEQNPDVPYWLVDPLDGTREFINKSKEFTVNIALIQNGSAIFGIVGAPATLEIWHGSIFDEPKALPIESDGENNRLRVVMSKSHQTEADKNLLKLLNNQNIDYQVVEKGSSLKLCALADNQADIYPRFGPTSEWDIAAGNAVLLGSGGTVSLLDSGMPLPYNKDDTILNSPFVACRNQYIKDRYFPILSEYFKKLV